MPGGNQLVAVIVDETVPSNEKHVWVSIANPRNLKDSEKKKFLSFSQKKGGKESRIENFLFSQKVHVFFYFQTFSLSWMIYKSDLRLRPPRIL